MSRRPYLTAATVAAAGRGLSDLDRLLLADLARVQTATGPQLRRLHYPPTSTGERRSQRDLKRLTEHRILQRLDRRIGGVRAGSAGHVYTLDVVGQRLVTPIRRQHWWPPRQPNERTLTHRLATTEVYVQLREREADGDGELLDFDAEPACWRSFTGPGGARLILKPDASAHTADGDWEHYWFLETDRATESLPWIVTKARVYVRYFQSGREQARLGLFPKVLWITPTERRAQQITEALASLPAEHWHLFAVTTAERAAEHIAHPDHINNTREEVTP